MTAVAVEKQKETSISKNLGRRRALGILGIVVALGALIVLSIAVGANPLSLAPYGRVLPHTTALRRRLSCGQCVFRARWWAS